MYSFDKGIVISLLNFLDSSEKRGGCPEERLAQAGFEMGEEKG